MPTLQVDANNHQEENLIWTPFDMPVLQPVIENSHDRDHRLNIYIEFLVERLVAMSMLKGI